MLKHNEYPYISPQIVVGRSGQSGNGKLPDGVD